jgi:hypothetical protein
MWIVSSEKTAWNTALFEPEGLGVFAVLATLSLVAVPILGSNSRLVFFFHRFMMARFTLFYGFI